MIDRELQIGVKERIDLLYRTAGIVLRRDRIKSFVHDKDRTEEAHQIKIMISPDETSLRLILIPQRSVLDYIQVHQHRVTARYIVIYRFPVVIDMLARSGNARLVKIELHRPVRRSSGG